MTISIFNSLQSTQIFIGILILALVLSIKRRKADGLSQSVSTELKGFAILAIIFAHIGYVLVEGHSFLFPISILAGTGVDLFLFLSGYGLTVSALRKDESILQFYKRRVSKLFIAFWIVLATFLLLDYFMLNISYPMGFVLPAFFGIFTHANAFVDFNSPFWYMTFMLLNYLLFPILFIKKYPWLSAGAVGAVAYSVAVYFSPLRDVAPLYNVHALAFPLGIFFAWIVMTGFFKKLALEPLKKYQRFIYPIVLLGLAWVIGYTALYSGVGKGIRLEQTYSLITMAAVILFFVLKKFEFRLLTLFGIYSYEIYLFHWPLMYRYDFLYKNLPAWLATVAYLMLFIFLGWCLGKVSMPTRQNPKI